MEEGKGAAATDVIDHASFSEDGEDEDSMEDYVPGSSSSESSSDYSDVIPFQGLPSAKGNQEAKYRKAISKMCSRALEARQAPQASTSSDSFISPSSALGARQAPQASTSSDSFISPSSALGAPPTSGSDDVLGSQSALGTSQANDAVLHNRKIRVMVADNEQGRKWDKIYYCLYCQKPQKKLPRHITTQHPDEVKVVEYCNEKNSLRKSQKMCLLRNLGNHKHNCEVLRKGEGILIVTHRPVRATLPDEYGPCEICFAYILRNDLWRHRCPLKDEQEEEPVKKKRRAVSCKLLLPPPPGISENLHTITHSMRADNISRITKSDNLILALGEKLYQKVGHNKFQHNYIRCKLREMGRLLAQLRTDTGKSNSKLEDFIEPDQFRVVLAAARRVCGFEKEGQTYKTPSLALKLGHSLRKCAKICQGQSIELNNEEKQKKVKSFLKLMDINWTEEMSTQALRTLYELKRNKVKLLPLVEDVHLLSAYLKETGKKAAAYLTASQSEDPKYTSQWDVLRDVLLVRLILFNRRRQGEVSHMSVEDYAKVHQAGHEGFVMESLTTLEQNLSRHFFRVEIRGKRGNTVPVLLNKECKEWLDVLVATREKVGIAPGNDYLFARSHYGSLDHVRGSDCLRDMSEQCGAREPQLLRTTKLRKQIATMSQILNLKDHELDVLARFLGHDIRVHREYYRLPDQTLQVAKVTKLLLAMEKGGQGLQLGQSLDDVNVNVDEEIDANSGQSSESDGDQGSQQDSSANTEASKRVSQRNIASQLEITPGSTTASQQKNTKQLKEPAETSVRRPQKKRGWNETEVNTVMRYFSTDIALGNLPGKSQIEAMLAAEQPLEHRSWRNVKDFIRNRIVSQKKL